MIKRPLNPRFSDAVREGSKFTTIRDKPWPVDEPIMLYNWSGAAYRSKQADVAAVEVIDTRPITISRTESGMMVFRYSGKGDERLLRIWKCEGFDSNGDMNDWFRATMKPGQSVTKYLMRFRLIKPPTLPDHV